MALRLLAASALRHCTTGGLWAAAAAGPSSLSAAAAATAAGAPRRGLHLAPPFLVEDHVPASVTTYRLGRMKSKVERALAQLSDCRACPRDCGVDRAAGKLGVCAVGRNAVVATVAPHYGGEGCLQGWMGSGTIFFSGCSMRCVFCQNWDIAHRPKGFELTAEELAGWMLKLQDEGKVHNVNLVTPEHVVPQIVEALALALEKGLSLPIVYRDGSLQARPCHIFLPHPRNAAHVDGDQDVVYDLWFHSLVGGWIGRLIWARTLFGFAACGLWLGAATDKLLGRSQRPGRPFGGAGGARPSPAPRVCQNARCNGPAPTAPRQLACTSPAPALMFASTIWATDPTALTVMPSPVSARPAIMVGSSLPLGRGADTTSLEIWPSRGTTKYNTSGYDSLESIELLDGLVDVYMPDFKFWTPESAEKYSRTADYPDRARAAIAAMHRQVGDLTFSPDGLARRGLLLRHLLMPGPAMLREGKAIVEWAAGELGRDTFVNLMPQYFPAAPVLGTGERRSRLGFVSYEELRARPSEADYAELTAHARAQGLWRFEEAPRYERAAEMARDGELAA
ncbi:pyruvate formate lyase-activating enzyme [Raphidocelis subcapitata]|uniref:Pyruvate formate lyase-activating enzyme n=1 Tax=Raphidocelis subcapitata TaxID=307507 RepID=A0A2V0P6K7_9CHLO|nr:pyruvate formate lyase-activating enzyme [Raphidocelis subcapitata]|eukprot:GBF95209.1 pyruvate formate lyase-activating enzyme [Raphidocelis subcapitata]